MTIELPADQKQRVLASLQAYCREHLECDPGLLRTEQLYEFVLGLVGATIYNRAIGNAQAWIQARLIDLEGDLHETVEYES